MGGAAVREAALASARERAVRSVSGIGAAYVGPPADRAGEAYWSGVVIVTDRAGVVEVLVVAENVVPDARVEPHALAWAVEQVVGAEGGLAGLEEPRPRIVLDVSDGRYALFPLF